MNQKHFLHLTDMLLSMKTSLEISFDVFFIAACAQKFLHVNCLSLTVVYIYNSSSFHKFLVQ